MTELIVRIKETHVKGRVVSSGRGSLIPGLSIHNWKRWVCHHNQFAEPAQPLPSPWHVTGPRLSEC